MALVLITSTSCIKRQPPFKTSAPECTAESTSLTCTAKREAAAALAAKQKPDPVKSKLDMTSGDSCGGGDDIPPQAKRGKSEMIIIPKSRPDPAKVKKSNLLDECLLDTQEDQKEAAWMKEFEGGGDPSVIKQQGLVNKLSFEEGRYQKCGPIMDSYVTESKIVNSTSTPNPSEETFANYLTDPNKVHQKLSELAKEYAFALLRVAWALGPLPGYNFDCETGCDTLTRYERVAQLVELMTKFDLRPSDMWKDGTGSQLREWSIRGYRELYSAWTLDNQSSAARDQLHRKLCTDLPKSGNLKPLMTVELDALDCEGKRTKYGECQSFKFSDYPRCAELAFIDTKRTCVLPSDAAALGSDDELNRKTYCAKLEGSALSSQNGCISDKDCKGDRICMDSKCVEPPKP